MSAVVQPPGRGGHAISDAPVQRLPREAYTCPRWFARERRDLFGRSWACAGIADDLPEPGDYATVLAGNYPLFVLRDDRGGLRAFHNLCRHRGTELVEGSGRLDGARIVCPYHRWTYGLDGGLRAVSMRARCFPGLEVGDYALLPAALGEFKGLLFAHPDPDADFGDWRSDLERVAWPHRFDRMRAAAETTYEIRCNWKVFFENAIDGYHLAYLHDRTLGGPPAHRNLWEAHGRHLVWYSTETGRKTCMPEALAESMADWGERVIDEARSGEYGGVFMLFPGTIVTAGPTQLSVSRLIGGGAGRQPPLGAHLAPRRRLDVAAPRGAGRRTAGLRPRRRPFPPRPSRTAPAGNGRFPLGGRVGVREAAKVAALAGVPVRPVCGRSRSGIPPGILSAQRAGLRDRGAVTPRPSAAAGLRGARIQNGMSSSRSAPGPDASPISPPPPVGAPRS